MTLAIPPVAWWPLLPVLVVTGTGLAVLLADLWMGRVERDALAWAGVIGLGVAALLGFVGWPEDRVALGGAMILDRFSAFVILLLCGASALTLLMSVNYLEATGLRSGEYYALVLFVTAGMMTMVATSDLIVLFLGLEIMSVGAYVLAGIQRREARSAEAALKYFLLGAFATGFLLYGIALLYGATGSTRLPVIAQKISGGAPGLLVLAGLALLLVGFGFKMAAAPFHLWAPDVYEGAPTSVTVLMAVGVKAAAFAAFVRVFLDYLAPLADRWTIPLWLVAALTMTVGNVLAISQRSAKRMLAYSSIAHAGYLLVGVVAGGKTGGAAVLYYLVAYAVMNIGAFGVLMVLARRDAAHEQIADLAGLGFRSPFLGAAMALFMLSLAGVPPLVGFTGKLYLFQAAVGAGYVGLVVVAVLNTLVSAYYYIRVIVAMYMEEGTVSVAAAADRPYLFSGVAIAAAGTVLLGLLPALSIGFARASFAALLS